MAALAARVVRRRRDVDGRRRADARLTPRREWHDRSQDYARTLHGRHGGGVRVDRGDPRAGPGRRSGTTSTPATSRSTTRSTCACASAGTRSARETKGRLDVQIFPNNQLGGDTQALQQLRSGALQFFTLDGGILQAVVPVAAIQGVGFAFKDSGEAFRAMDGPLGDYVRDAIRKQGLYVHPKMWENGMRQITSGDQADPQRGRPRRLQDPHPGRRAVGRPVQVDRRGARAAELQRGLHRAPDARLRRPGEPLRDHRHRAPVRGAEVPQRDQPHVVGLPLPGQRRGLEGAAARRPGAWSSAT